MHINFQQNRVCISAKTVHTNLFAKKRKLHKFATTNSNFEKLNSFRHADRQTDGRTDGWTDVAYDNNMYFFGKKRKIY